MNTRVTIVYRGWLLCLTCLLMVSCFEEEVVGHAERANRTVLYYMEDNGLSASRLQEKTDSLVSAWSPDGVNYLLLYQDAGDGNAPGLTCIHTGTDGKGVAEVVATYDNTSVLPENVFAGVLNDVMRLYPASDYGLIMCTRTSGWLPEDTGVSPRSVSVTGRRRLELREFASAIPDGQFRFIVFEGNHMAGVEVAYELKDKTETILASAGEIPAEGFTRLYAKLLPAIYAETPRPEQFAADYNEYFNGLRTDKQAATASVIRTGGLEALKPLLSDAESHVEHWEYIDRTGMQHFDNREENYLFYDLADYIRGIGTEEENARLGKILAGTVTYSAAPGQLIPDAGYSPGIRHHCGLTIYIPWAQFTFLNGERRKLKLFTD